MVLSICLYSKPFLIEMPEPPSTQLKTQQMLGAAYGNGLMSVVSDLVSQGSRNSSHNIIREPTYGSSYMNEGFPQYSTEMVIVTLSSVLCPSPLASGMSCWKGGLLVHIPSLMLIWTYLIYPDFCC